MSIFKRKNNKKESLKDQDIELGEAVEENNVEENNVEETETEEPKTLYIVTDNAKPGLLNYFRESGLKVSAIYKTLGEARDTLLIQSGACRMIIIDTGLGKFSATGARDEIIDMISLRDESNIISVFYTDSIIRNEAKSVLGSRQKDIEWYRYETTAKVVATILSLGDTYEYYFEEEDEELISKEKAFRFSGSREIVETKIHNKGLTSSIINKYKEGEEFEESGYIDGFELEF